ncbi:MAG: hypothetical protein FWH35_03320 [Treponema sp.]|nr:hypothetical protein [Treponema sp.]
MLNKNYFWLLFMTFMMFISHITACSNKKAEETVITPSLQGISEVIIQGTESEQDIESLDKIAEMERSGRFTPGLGFVESGIRERAGDIAGSVVAAYKELCWTYAFSDKSSANSMDKIQIREGLLAILGLYGGKEWAPMDDFDDIPVNTREDGHAAATAVLYFIDERWKEAGDLLGILFSGEEEIDSFSQWMILICSLEQGNASRGDRQRYSAIRSRYGYFPPYWYHLARCTEDEAARMDAAERCINLSPNGPYAMESRGIIASLFNIETSNGGAILVRREIESLITNTVSSRNPEILHALFPLIELPDNPYTMYAIGAMRALCADVLFKDFYIQEATRSNGRLNERLNFISRG